MSEENIVEDQNVSEGLDPIETVEGGQNSETPNIEKDEEVEEQDHAATIETLQQRLLTALVEADGRLQDPTDFPFNPDFLDDKDSLTEAIGNLIETKPHLKKRRVGGDIGAGNRGDSAPEVPDLINIIRSMK